MFRQALIASAGAVLVAGALALPAEAKAYEVTLKTDSAKTDVKDDFRLSGEVTGSGAGNKQLIVQRKIGSSGWKNYSTVTTRPTGTYSKSFEMLSPGAKQFRVLVPKAGSLTTGTSNVKTITGYSWLSLAKRGTETISVDFDSGSYGFGITGNNVKTRVDGHDYPHSIRFLNLAGSQSGTANVIVANLDGKCDEASFGYGLDESSPEGATPSSFLAVGAASFFSEGFAHYYVGSNEEPGQATFEHKKVRTAITSDVDYFIAGTQSQSSEESGVPGTTVLTTPRVHCSTWELPDSNVAKDIFTGPTAQRSSAAKAFRG